MLRQDYEKYLELLQKKGIDKLYHITSCNNWESIRKKGLYPVKLLKQRGIEGYHSYADSVTKKCDAAIGADHYIHLSFTPNPIFLEAGLKAGHIDTDYLILEISPEVIKDSETEFCNMNLHYDEVKYGSSYEILESINFSCATATAREDIKLNQRKYCQAEILVKGHIPPEYIINKHELDNIIHGIRIGNSIKRRAIIFLIDQTITMGDKYIMSGKQYPSIASAVQQLVNKFMCKISKSFFKDGKPINLYDVAVLGTTDNGAVPLWNINTFDAVYQNQNDPYPFLSAEDMYNIHIAHFLSDSFNWINVNYDAWNAHTVDSLRTVKEYLSKWINANNSDNYPPVVIYISEGSQLQYDTASFVKICSEIRSLQTRTGNAMLWQLEYTPYHSDIMLLPTDADIHGLDPTGNFMYQQASEISNIFAEQINTISSSTYTQSSHRAMGVNADINVLSDLILEC